MPDATQDSYNSVLIDDFLTARLKCLQDDVAAEMDKIAKHQMIQCRKGLHELREQNAELQAKVRILEEEKASCRSVSCFDKDKAVVFDDSEATTSISRQDTPLQEDSSKVIVTIDDTMPVSWHSGEPFESWQEWAPEGVRHRHHSIRELSRQRTEFLVHLIHEPTEAVGGKCYTIGPNSVFVMIWQLCGTPLLFYDLLMIPLQVFIPEKPTWSKILSWIISSYWTTDLFLFCFFIGYISPNGAVQLDRRMIINNYLRTSFFVDLALVLPDWLSLIVASGFKNAASLRAIRLIRLLRLFRMTKLRGVLRVIHDAVDSEYMNIVVSISTYVAIIVGCCHYLACLWYWVGTQKVEGYTTWVEFNEITDREWTYKYAMSFFWALTQFTPASCRIQPTSPPEVMVSLFVILFGMVFFSVFISSITSERAKMQALHSKHDADHWRLRRYFRQNGVSNDLLRRTIRFVDTVVAPMVQTVQRKDVALLDYLSVPLQLEVQSEIFCKSLLVHPLFDHLKQNNGSWACKFFADVVAQLLLAQTDELFQSGQVCHEMYFIKQGALAYCRQEERMKVPEVEHICSKDWICEPVLWMPWEHQGTAKATEECHLIAINSAYVRRLVVESNEHCFFVQCAKGYVNDLNSYVNMGRAITDTIRITDDESSEYMTTISADRRSTAAARKSSFRSFFHHTTFQEKITGGIP